MKTVRIKIPVGSPESALDLSKDISDRHTELGDDSPLTDDVDMDAFEANRAAAAQKFKASKKAAATAQKKHYALMLACGIAEGQSSQSRDTLYWFVLKCRDSLLLTHKGVEETLEEYGYAVVISQARGRKYVRVKIHDRNPDALLEQALGIIVK